MRHNRIIQSNHLRKHWRNRIKTYFDQPGKKVRRRRLRAEKAAKISPVPVAGPLRPLVQCPTFKYNMKSRTGRGFTLKELKLAGISKLVAPTIGIAVDHRRVNKSQENMDVNIQRLKEYMRKLILFPKKTGMPKKGDSTTEVLESAKQLKSKLLPRLRSSTVSIGRISDFKASKGAFETLKEIRDSRRVKEAVAVDNN